LQDKQTLGFAAWPASQELGNDKIAEWKSDLAGGSILRFEYILFGCSGFEPKSQSNFPANFQLLKGQMFYIEFVHGMYVS